MVEVELSKVECKIAQYLGRLRNGYSLETKTNLRRDTDQDDESMNVQAMGAELAVAKYLNVYPDMSPTTGELRHWDLLWDGLRIEVKRNHLRGRGDLLIPNLQPLTYVLARGYLPKYELVGFLLGRDVPLRGAWVQLSKGPCWRVRPAELNDIKEMRNGKDVFLSRAVHEHSGAGSTA